MTKHSKIQQLVEEIANPPSLQPRELLHWLEDRYEKLSLLIHEEIMTLQIEFHQNVKKDKQSARTIIDLEIENINSLAKLDIFMSSEIGNIPTTSNTDAWISNELNERIGELVNILTVKSYYQFYNNEISIFENKDTDNEIKFASGLSRILRPVGGYLIANDEREKTFPESLPIIGRLFAPKLSNQKQELSSHIDHQLSGFYNQIDNQGDKLIAEIRDQLTIHIRRELDRHKAELQHVTTELSAQQEVAEVEFSCFYPRDVYVEERYSVYVYAHLEGLVEKVKSDSLRFMDEFGDKEPSNRSSKSQVRLEVGTPISIMLVSDSLNFDPPSLTRKWKPDWTRFHFEFTVPSNIIGQTAFVEASVSVQGIEISRIKFAIDVYQETQNYNEVLPISAQKHLVGNRSEENSLMSEKLSKISSQMYQKIFVSYSRKDTQVTRAYKFAQEALGNEVFIDVDNLRAGENWKAGIASAIDESDKFQLFWSKNSSTSEYCKQEWQYALLYKCPEDKCVEFITPVYWTKNLPNVPKELQHLNFKYIPFYTDHEMDSDDS